LGEIIIRAKTKKRSKERKKTYDMTSFFEKKKLGDKK